jgi:signal transduction histidine kinase
MKQFMPTYQTQVVQVRRLPTSRAQHNYGACSPKPLAIEMQPVQLMPPRVRVDEISRQSVPALVAAAVQAERTRVVQVLHDDVVQWLFLARLRFSALAQTLKGAASSKVTRSVEECLSASSNAVRSLMADLESPVLAALVEPGMNEALSGIGGEFQKLHGLTVLLTGPRMDEPDFEARREILLSVRELLMNIVKYGGVVHEEVRLSSSKHGMSIEVRDKGVGFDSVARALKPPVASEGGYGMRRMVERMATMDGTVDVRSAVGRGTNVTLLIPWLADRHPIAVLEEIIGAPALELLGMSASPIGSMPKAEHGAAPYRNSRSLIEHARGSPGRNQSERRRLCS